MFKNRLRAVIAAAALAIVAGLSVPAATPAIVEAGSGVDCWLVCPDQIRK